MNDDKLKELEANAENNRLERRVLIDPITVIDLIKSYRQLEKDFAEEEARTQKQCGQITDLLAALKRYNETIENYVTMENEIPFDDPAYKDDVEIINKVRQITKHKGESELREKYPKEEKDANKV